MFVYVTTLFTAQLLNDSLCVLCAVKRHSFFLDFRHEYSGNNFSFLCETPDSFLQRQEKSCVRVSRPLAITWRRSRGRDTWESVVKSQEVATRLEVTGIKLRVRSTELSTLYTGGGGGTLGTC